MNKDLIEYGLLCFTTLFTMMNPVGVIPHYIAMTEMLDAKQSRRIAIRAIFIATIIMFLFALTGSFLFNFFSISIHSMRIMGLIVMVIAVEFFFSGLKPILQDIFKITGR